MKKSWILTSLSLAFVSLAMIGCEKDGHDDKPVPLPTKEVTTAFQSRYPGAANVDWEAKGMFQVADFTFENSSCEAWYQQNGSRIFTEKELTKAQVPAKVISSFEGDFLYGTWTPDHYMMLDQQSLEARYVVEAEKNRDEVFLYYDVDGVMKKTRTDLYLPNRPDYMTAINAFIAKSYPRAVVLETYITSDSNTAVEIVDGGSLKEVLFFQNSWVETRERFPETELPQAVKQTLTGEAYSGYTVDEIYFTSVNGGTEYYNVFLKKPNSVDMSVKIKEDGSLVLN